jgi:hypothetical protein
MELACEIIILFCFNEHARFNNIILLNKTVSQ